MDEAAITVLGARYVQSVKAWATGGGASGGLDEPLMRSIETEMGLVADGPRADFRRELMGFIGALAVEGRAFDPRSHARLGSALRSIAARQRADAGSGG
jgi:serine protein kinase